MELIILMEEGVAISIMRDLFSLLSTSVAGVFEG